MLELKAYAKINWTLDILATDERGYHLLDMLMQNVSLFDRVGLEASDEFLLEVNKPYIPVDRRNTVFKAAEAFFGKLKKPMCAHITVVKNIPSGAGLAGGSADAAATLKGLNELYGFPLSDTELASIALSVGADVPFMLFGRGARACGIGEKLEFVKMPEQVLLLVMDTRQPASTKTVYKTFDTLSKTNAPQTDKFLSALCAGDFAKMREFGGNVLFRPAMLCAPSVKKSVDVLYSSGALYASMTGSGSACFGVFGSVAEALRAKRKINAAMPELWARAVYTVSEEE